MGGRCTAGRAAQGCKRDVSILSNASANTDQADMAILAMVETIRDQEQPATASAVASLIGGAPEGEIRKRLSKLWYMGLVEDTNDSRSFQLTEMGAELMRQD